MITDSETNKLFLADCLPTEQSEFFQRFEKIFKENSIIPDIEFLPNTKDIWAVDYMPIQIDKDNFVQFSYNPDYLKPKRRWKTISEVNKILNELPNNFRIKTEKSDLKVDGGNIVRAKDKVIMCDKVFSENPKLKVKTIIKKLEELLKVDKIIFIPWQKDEDITGHADGMVRFLDDRTVLINDYDYEEDGEMEFGVSVKAALHNAGLEWEEIPYNPYDNESDWDARGIYINYLQMKDIVFVPQFKFNEDDEAMKMLSKIFPKSKIVPVLSNEIAEKGGILNCISWNILKQ